MSAIAVELLMLKGMVSDFAPAEQEKVRTASAELRALIIENPQIVLIAMAIVSLEAQQFPEKYGLPA